MSLNAHSENGHCTESVQQLSEYGSSPYYSVQNRYASVASGNRHCCNCPLSDNSLMRLLLPPAKIIPIALMMLCHRPLLQLPVRFPECHPDNLPEWSHRNRRVLSNLNIIRNHGAFSYGRNAKCINCRFHTLFGASSPQPRTTSSPMVTSSATNCLFHVYILTDDCIPHDNGIPDHTAPFRSQHSVRSRNDILHHKFLSLHR